MAPGLVPAAQTRVSIPLKRSSCQTRVPKLKCWNCISAFTLKASWTPPLRKRRTTRWAALPPPGSCSCPLTPASSGRAPSARVCPPAPRPPAPAPRPQALPRAPRPSAPPHALPLLRVRGPCSDQPPSARLSRTDRARRRPRGVCQGLPTSSRRAERRPLAGGTPITRGLMAPLLRARSSRGGLADLRTCAVSLVRAFKHVFAATKASMSMNCHRQGGGCRLADLPLSLGMTRALGPLATHRCLRPLSPPSRAARPRRGGGCSASPRAALAPKGVGGVLDRGKASRRGFA